MPEVYRITPLRWCIVADSLYFEVWLRDIYLFKKL